MPFPLQRWIAFFLMASVANFSYAAVPPPASPYGIANWKAVSKDKPATGLRMGAIDIQFEKTTLARVAQAVGRGEIAQQGEAGASIYWLCYTLVEAKYSKRLWIISNGEMGGREHAVTQIAAEEIPAAVDAKDCPAFPDKLLPLSFGKDLRLGAEKSKALAILGRPSYQTGRLWIFGYEGHIPGSCEPHGSLVNNWLSFEVKGERIVRIYAGQVTSC